MVPRRCPAARLLVLMTLELNITSRTLITQSRTQRIRLAMTSPLYTTVDFESRELSDLLGAIISKLPYQPRKKINEVPAIEPTPESLAYAAYIQQNVASVCSKQ